MESSTMPTLVRKLAIFAAVDGLILQPYGNGGQRSSNGVSSPIRIDYRTQKIESLSTSPPNTAIEKRNEVLDVHGIVGLLRVASFSFLVSITQREQVAQICGKPIYTITNVAVIPLSSQDDANKAISQARLNQLASRQPEGNAQVDESDETGPEDEPAEGNGADSPADEPSSPRNNPRVDSSIAQEVIGNKGRLDRTPWFSKRRWMPASSFFPGFRAKGPKPSESTQVAEKESKTPGSDLAEAKTEAEVAPTIIEETSQEQQEQKQEGPQTLASVSNLQTPDLMPKLLRYTRLLFSSRNFFYSYDYDLTRNYGQQDSSRPNLPLHCKVDPLYFWNFHLSKPLIESDSHHLVLPLIQGFVGQREFTVASTGEKDVPVPKVDETETDPAVQSEANQVEVAKEEAEKQSFQLTLISRRSVKRPGLRYLRRGVDDDGNTANFVETEQILSTPDWDPSRKVYSLLQLRGSIPLYFSQSPYSLKPTPIMHHSTETNQTAFDRHFRDINQRYGKIQSVSLVDKHGGEAKIGEEYEKYTRTLNDSGGINGMKLDLEWFDFHNECRGMKFENVRKLVDKLEDTLEDFGQTIIRNSETLQEQKGIVRTNCMDCLDRTGVAQCAFGQRALEKELENEGFNIDLQGDISTQWFNTLWADNGDAISRQYASTAALKGDYTRTRKRNYRGALNDFGLTLSRYYNNIVNDFFSQACIDYLLGNVSYNVFSEFQVDLQSADPGVSAQKLRQNAIDTSARIVIDDQTEELLGGWIMLTPRQPNTLRTLPLEESVLLLTDAAIYCCRFDWDTDKVLSFERIDLRCVQRIQCGTYITSVLTEAQTDERRNVGLVIAYQPGNMSALRVNTRSLQSLVKQDAQDKSSTETGSSQVESSKGTKQSTSRFLAFKALARTTSVTANNPSTTPEISELDTVRTVCQEIERAMMAGDGRHPEKMSVTEEKDIISLAEAKKRTGYLEQLVYDVKKLVWA